jgi:hypothetical protein
MQNLSSGPFASSDFVATANNGNDLQYFIDMGIASSTYNYPGYSAITPNDGYVIVNGGNVLVNASSPAKFINFAAGGSDLVNIVGTWSNVALTVKNNLTVLGNISYTMGNASNWNTSVTNVSAALDALAALTTYAKTKEITHSANILAAPSSFGDGSSIGISDNYQTEYVSITNALGDLGRATLPNIATIGKTVIITSSAAHATQVDYYSWASAHGGATISNSTNGVAILMSLGSGKWKQLQRND